MGLFGSGQEGKNVIYKTHDEVEQIRAACWLNCQVIAYVGSLIKPGITGKQLDEKAEEFILDHGAKPAFKGYRDSYPNTLTVSINDVVVHGIPNQREIKETDVVSIDCGVYLNGFYGDAAYTYCMNQVAPEVIALLQVTYRSLYEGIDKAIVGGRLQDISFAVQDYTERKHGYGVVRELVGHGLGRSLHEDPEVPNYGKRGKGMLLKDGLVIAIEPMINLGKKEVYQAEDGWTIHTRDRKPSAHYEHTICVRKGKADILSNHEFILDAIKNNAEMQIILPKS
jgi:methionyl aminopeptidase